MELTSLSSRRALRVMRERRESVWETEGTVEEEFVDDLREAIDSVGD